MPKLIDNVQDKKYAAARLKALDSIGNAVKSVALTEGMNCGVDAEDFVKNCLSKKLKMIKMCENSGVTNANNPLRSCGIETMFDKIYTAEGKPTYMALNMVKLAGFQNTTTIDYNNNNSYGFIMANGYSVNLFYNPNCLPDTNVSHLASDMICVNAIYDMNGLNGPNQFGKDIGFVTVLYPDEGITAVAPDPYPFPQRTNFINAQKVCTAIDKDLFVADKNELASLALNKRFIVSTNANYFYSSTTSWGSVGYNKNIGLAWAMKTSSSNRFLQNQGDGGYCVFCVKKNTIK